LIVVILFSKQRMPENEDIHTTGVCGAPQQEINHGINKEKNCGDFEIQYRSSLSLSLLSVTYTHTQLQSNDSIRFIIILSIGRGGANNSQSKKKEQTPP
jgi:hypothetical protein